MENNLRLEQKFQDLKVTDNVREDIIKYYEDDATKEMREFVDDTIGNVKGKNVLDVGCGVGGSTIQALKDGAFVTAIDISPESINYVKALAQKMGVEKHLTAEVMDAQNMSLDDESFDIVIGRGVLHHLPDFERSIREIKRVLKKDGYAVFSEPMGINPFINLYRILTPKKRTKGEQPFKMEQINTIKKIFPNSEFYFFENAVLLNKILIALHLNTKSSGLQKKLAEIDKKYLRNNDRITFYKKMSWIVVIKLKNAL